MYQLQLEVSGKWLDCGLPVEDRDEAITKYLNRVNQKTGDAFRLLKIEVYRSTLKE